jgi:hypothetical protein
MRAARPRRRNSQLKSVALVPSAMEEAPRLEGEGLPCAVPPGRRSISFLFPVGLKKGRLWWIRQASDGG